VDHPVQQRHRRPGAEWSLARGGEGEHGAEVEDVARRADLVAHGLLGGHEPGRPDHQARLGQHGGFRGPGDAEIDDPRTVLGQQHVRRLEVPVHHTRDVDRVQAFRQARGQRQQRRLGQRTVGVDGLFQRRPGDVRGRHPGHRSVDVGVHHLGGENAAHPPRRGDLPAETPPEIRVRGEFGADGFYCHRPSARGDAEVHPPHTALAELPHQPVRTDRLRIPRLQFADQSQSPPDISRRAVLPTEPSQPR
jgi:hypothetical protein